MKKLIVILSIIFFGYLGGDIQGAVYYLSPTGSDSNTGTIESPWWTIDKAWTVIVAGDTIYLRGGTYIYTDQIYLSGKSGTAGNLINIWAYPGESPKITRAETWTHDPATSAGIYMSADYTYWRGLEIAGFYQEDSNNWPGFWQQGSSHNKYERLNYHHNGFPFLIGIDNSDGSDDNLILNSDFHHNYDPLTPDAYGNADGIAVNVAHNMVNTIRGCRMWDNSDDGIDALLSDGQLIVDNCWAWMNGYTENGGDARDGHGFKLQEGTTEYLNEVNTIITNCLAFHNRKAGISMGNSTWICHAYNNTAYHNADGETVYNLGFEFSQTSGAVHILRNNIAHANQHPSNLQANYLNCTEDHNSWDNGYTISDADFISVDTTGVSGARQSDGSLPNLDFLKLVNGSDMIDTGVDVGLSYEGTAPDLGAYEFVETPAGGNPPKKIRFGTHLVRHGKKLVKGAI